MGKEYIEREALVRVLTAVLEEIEGIIPFGEKNAEFKDGIIKAKKADINCIKNFESADVEPVVHGEWIPIVNYFHGKPDGRYYCSVCHRVETTKGIYCRLCGARMDKGSAAARS